MIANIFSFLSGTIAEKFEANFRAQRTDSFAKFLVEYSSKEEAVNSAFVWGKTPEGYRFWKAVENLWKKFMKEGGEPIHQNPKIEKSHAVRSLIDSGPVSNLGALTFSLIGTPEGREYWSQISDMWEEYWEAKTGMRAAK